MAKAFKTSYSCFIRLSSIAYVAILGFILFPAMVTAQQSKLVDEINLMSERNAAEDLTVMKVFLEVDTSDSLSFNVAFERNSITKRVYMGNVFCMNVLPYYEKHILGFYIKSGNDSVSKVELYDCKNYDSMKVLFNAFNSLFLEKGYPIPPTTCAHYENDLIAQKFEFRTDVDLSRMAIIFMLDTVFEGYFYLHHVNGNLRLERTMKNGKLSGTQKDYYENGVLSYEGAFREGFREGAHLSYYMSGALKTKSLFVKGRYHGESVIYSENGQMVTRVIFKDGKVQSEEYWDEEGNVLTPPE